MVDQPNLEQAAVADETAQSPAQDATEPQQKEAAPPPKEEPAEPPPWLNAPLDAGPAQSPYVPHYGGQNYQPQYQIPPPQFGPPARQQFQPGRKLTLQELAADQMQRSIQRSRSAPSRWCCLYLRKFVPSDPAWPSLTSSGSGSTRPMWPRNSTAPEAPSGTATAPYLAETRPFETGLSRSGWTPQ